MAALIGLGDDGANPGFLKTTYTELTDTHSAILSSTQTVYDQQGRVDYEISDTGLKTQYHYDAAGRQERIVVDPDNPGSAYHTQTVYTYDAAGRQTRVTDALGRVIEHVYDDLGRVVQTIQHGDLNDLSDNLVSTTEYDSLGRQAAETDALGRRTVHDYDEAGRLTSVTLPEVTDAAGTGSTTGSATYTYGYDDYGNRTSITDPNGHITQFTYDHLNRQVSRTLPLGQVESMHYDDRALSEVTNLAASTALGQIAYQVDFEGRITGYKYDNTAAGRGRLVEKAYFDGANALSGYLAWAGDSANLADRKITYTYDAFGRVVVTNDDAFATSTNTKYDAEGRVTQIESPEGVLNYEYDDLGRMIRTFTTATAGSTDAITDTRYGYDALGRLDGVTMVERNDTAVAGLTISWNGTTITGEHTQYHYNVVGSLERIEQTTHDGANPHTVTTKHTYDVFDRLTDIHQFVDGNANQAADTGEWIASFRYDLDKAGNRIQADERFDLDGDGDFYTVGGDDLLQTFYWTYDALNRLVEERFDLGSNGTADAADYITHLAFDLASNRLQQLKDAGNADPLVFTADETTTYTYDENDRLLTEQKSGTSTEYTEYEYGSNAAPANGDGGDHTTQTRKTVYTDNTKATKVSETTFTYDATGRMTVTVEKKYIAGVLDSTTTTTYTYNDSGLRVRESIDDGTTVKIKEYLFDSQNHTGYAQVLEEYLNGQLTKVSTLGHDLLTEAHVVEADAGTATGAGDPYTLLYDGHGSTRVLLDASMAIAEMQSGAGVLQVFSYDAYGNMLDQSSITVGSKALASTIVQALTAKLYSGEHTNLNGVQYLRARWYDPMTGRFSRLDPFVGSIIRPASLHKYLYTEANPVTGIDPSGKVRVTVRIAITRVISTFIGVVVRAVGVAVRTASASARVAFTFIRTLPSVIRQSRLFNQAAVKLGQIGRVAQLTPPRWHHIIQRHISTKFFSLNQSLQAIPLKSSL